LRKITFENEINGLSCEFSTDTPLMFLESFDGCSCGSDAIVYKPIEYDGQRFISSNLTARTVQFTANFGGKSGGRYSREAALSRWQDVQKVFVPGQIGKLTWTDGENSRFIKCRTNETPMPTEMMPYLFRVGFSLTADSPLWFDTVENEVEFGTRGTVTIDNDCGIEVPFVLTAEGTDLFILLNKTTGGWLGFTQSPGSGTLIIDTAECTVKNDDGELINNRLGVKSEFFNIVPGLNEIGYTGASGVTIRWRKAYMGVY
jgi:hypothetical protein